MELYNNLLALSNDDTTPFYHIDQFVDADLYRIFSYHYTDKDSWTKPAALESRGIMFEIDDAGNPLRIAARPMHKFFNPGEVDFIQYSTPVSVMTKADGSLISSFTASTGALRLKSKASVESFQALKAMEVLNADADLKDFVLSAESQGYTVNMELVAPDNRVILLYPEPKLFLLNCRNRETGEYIPLDQLPTKYFVGFETLEKLDTLTTDTGIEGYVVIDVNNNWWKVKTDWYLKLHAAKDYIERPLAFIELVLDDKSDDVLNCFHDDKETQDKLEAIRHKVVTVANHIINTVTNYWTANKHLSRKDYAIKGRAELESLEFGLAMNYYTSGSEPIWNEVFLSKIKQIEWMKD